MFALLADENFDDSIVRGLQRVLPALDIVTVQELELSVTKDPELLARAWEHSRVFITHDVQSMNAHVQDRLAAGRSIAGVIAVPRLLPIGRAIYELRICIECADFEEWRDQINRVPL